MATKSSTQGPDAPASASVPETSTLKEQLLRSTPAASAYFVDAMGSAVVLPLLPVYVASLGFGPEAVGTVLSAQFAGQMCGTPVFGFVADRFGPKISLMCALGGSGVFYGLTAFTTNVPTLAAVRFLGTFCSAEGGAPKWIVDATTLEHRDTILGMAVLFGSVGFIIGAIIGGFTSWLVACLVAAGTSAATVVSLCALRSPARAAPAERRSSADGRPETHPLRKGLQALGYWLSVTAAVGAGVLYGAVFTLPGIALVDLYGRDASDVSAMFLIGVGLILVVQLTCVPAASRFLSPELLMNLGLLIGGTLFMACALFLRAGSHWPLTIVGAASMTGLLLALIKADLVASAHLQPISNDIVGTLMGLQNVAHFGSVAITPSACTALYTHTSPEAAFVVAGAVTLAIGAAGGVVALAKRAQLEEAKRIQTADTSSGAA